MIVGVGVDTTEISRLKKACERESFRNRCFTEREREMARENPAFLAGNFAVKEAVAKALGCGFRGFWPGDIEVLRDEMGKPYVTLLKGAALTAGQLGIDRWFVSISDTGDLVTAMAVAEKGNE